MTRLFILICLMTMVSPLGMGAENPTDHADLPTRLDSFRQAVSNLKRLEDIPERNPQEEEHFQEARRIFRRTLNGVLYLEMDVHAYDNQRTRMALMNQRARGLTRIIEEFRLAQGINY